MLAIENHRLQGVVGGKHVEWVPSGNHNGEITPKYLIFHYTACSYGAAKNTFLSNTGSKRTSAHLLVDLDGSVTQFVPLNRRAWHAGESAWGTLRDLNSHSIGIEVVNFGYLLKMADSTFKLYNGTLAPVHPGDIVEAQHKNPTVRHLFWQSFSAAQIETCEALAAHLADQYGILDVLGHDDIAPGRKQDPGPAFPLLSIRGKALGRNAPIFDEDAAYVAVPMLNIRKGPGIEYALAGTPLVQHTRLRVVERVKEWMQVEVESAGMLTGWVFENFTRAAAL